MTDSQLLVVTVSRWWIVIECVAFSALAGLGLWILASGEVSKIYQILFTCLMVVGPPFLIAESLTERYEFGPDIVRYRTDFRWHEQLIPLSMRLKLTADDTVTLQNADSEEVVLELPKRFTGWGLVMDEIAAYYRKHNREVEVDPNWRL